MKKTLWSRLVVCYILSGVLVFLLINTYGSCLLEKKLREDKINLMAKEARLISAEYISNYYGSSLSLAELKTQLTSIDNYLNLRIWIVSSGGDIIADSASSIKVLNKNLFSLKADFLDNIITDNLYFKEIFNEPMLSYTKTIDYNQRIRGYIVLFIPQRELTDGVNYYMDVVNIYLLIFLPLLFFIFLYLYYITAIPLKHLTKAAQEYNAGNYNYPIPLRGLPEYRDLAATLSYMSQELGKLEDYQKNFVANISHDFRSPLTSIKGFAEAIKDGTIPHEMQDKYLDIILFETDRLNKLTSNLLELNNFETKGAFLDVTSFDINHIIKKTAESFEGRCRDKKITLNLVFSDKELYVDADMGKVQQVLYNLIDNAIKFSHPNSIIKVSSEEKGEKVFISVKDYGVGIPKDSIKKIWERFYKTDPSRGKDKHGTGLGLSITKEILQAHNENINVISTEGVGSEFIFSLPKTGE